MQRFVLCALTLVSLFAISSVEASETCPTGQAPDACLHGLCTPFLGLPPALDTEICCDAAGVCTEAGPRGCWQQSEYHCEYGEIDPASGQLECMFGTWEVLAGDPPPAADEQQLCCNGGGCTIAVAGCEQGGGWIGYCYGDLLIMEDGSAHCYQEDC